MSSRDTTESTVVTEADKTGVSHHLTSKKARSEWQAMFAVIFEVNPKPEHWEAYLGYAKLLRPELEQIDGFIENERFSSLRRPGWVLSLSLWRDEKAVMRWRTSPRHREVQHKGRNEVFRDYHLRVGEIIAYNQLPVAQTGAAAKLVELSEATADDLPHQPDAETIAARLGAPSLETQPELLDWDVFESIYERGNFILLTSWRNAAAVEGRPLQRGGNIRHRLVRVIRDYGMFDRVEAPQYFPPVARVV